jgi:hypothetical protein
MPRIIRAVAFLGTGVFLSGGAQPSQGPGFEEYRCNYEARYACTKSGCKPIQTAKEVASAYLLVPSLLALEQAARRAANVEIRLCDNEGCTPVEMHASSDGAFLDLTQANRGTQYMKIFTSSAKMPNIGQMPGHSRGDFSEVEDLLLLTIVGYGHCEWPSK